MRFCTRFTSYVTRPPVMRTSSRPIRIFIRPPAALKSSAVIQPPITMPPTTRTPARTATPRAVSRKVSGCSLMHSQRSNRRAGTGEDVDQRADEDRISREPQLQLVQVVHQQQRPQHAEDRHERSTRNAEAAAQLAQPGNGSRGEEIRRQPRDGG